MPTLYLAPTANFIQTTLNGAITNAVTTITLTSTANMQAPGYVVIDRTDSNGVATAAAREVVLYTGISGSNLTGVTRGADNSTARSHADGAVVETVPTVGMFNSLATIVASGLDTQGLLLAIASPVTILQENSNTKAITSIASIARAETTALVNPSNASISGMYVGTRLDVSAASVSGFARTFVWYMPGFASAATTNVMRLIAPFGGTFRSFTMTTRTPVSTASLTVAVYNIRSGASIFDTIGRPNILGGGTFVSTASILTPNFIAGDTFRSDIETGGSVADLTLEGIAY